MIDDPKPIVQALDAGRLHALELAVSCSPLEAILTVLCRAAEEQSDNAAQTAIFTSDGDQQHMYVAAAPTLPKAFSVAIDGMTIGADAGSCGAAVLSSQPCITRDIGIDPRWAHVQGLAQEHGLRSCWSMPIISPEGLVLGTFASFRRSVHAPDERECQAVALLANTAALVIARDNEAHKRRQAEDALVDARSRVEATLAAGEVATWTWDIKANRVIADRNLKRLFSVSEAEAEGGELGAYTRAIHPDDLAAVTSTIEAVLHDGGKYEAAYRVRHEDGEYHHVVARGKVERDGAGNALRMPGVIIDVTRQRLAEAALHASEQRYHTLFDLIDEGFCIIEMIDGPHGPMSDYRFVEANAAFADQTGLQDAIGKTMRELAPTHDAHWFAIYGRVAETGEPTRFVEEATALGRWFDVYAARLGGQGSRSVAILFKDITAQRHADDQLRQLAGQLADADRRKDEFLATLAHELRNPLAPIRNGLHLMRVAANKPATVEQVRSMMERQLDHLVRLVNDLLDIARISNGRFELAKELVDLRDVLDRALEISLPLIEAAHHELTLDVPPIGTVSMIVDPVRLAQVLSNLLNNAAKYTPNGGHVGLAMRTNDDAVVIVVTDSGMGIPPEALPEIFGMFNQLDSGTSRRHGGLGIGLALVRRIAEMHGGSVEAISDGPGRGSRFTVTLPRSSLDP